MMPEATPSRPLRCFIALPLGPELQREISLLQRHLHRQLPQLRLPRPETLHLTLRFFAALPELHLEKIAATMVSVGSFFAPFDLHLSQLGAFPSPGRAQVLWLGGESEPLQRLYQALDDGLAAAGLPREARPFRAHITIARSRGNPPAAGHILSHLGRRLDLRQPVDRLVLYESRLQPTGALHLPRHTVLLTGGGPAG